MPSSPNVLKKQPSTIPVIAIPLPPIEPRLCLMSPSPSAPRMIAGMPVKIVHRNEQIPRTRLAIALPLVRGATQGARPDRSPAPGTGYPRPRPHPLVLGMIRSVPHSGQRARRPAFSSFVSNCLPHLHVTGIGTGVLSAGTSVHSLAGTTTAEVERIRSRRAAQEQIARGMPQKESGVATSPPLRVARASSVVGDVEFLRNRTEPSANGGIEPAGMGDCRAPRSASSGSRPGPWARSREWVPSFPRPSACSTCRR